MLSLYNAFQYLRSVGINSGVFWINLIYGLGFAVIAWGLLRLKEWARFLSMLTIALWAGQRLPLYLLNARHFDFSYFLIVTEELIDLFAVWYLFRLPTAEYFSKLEKTA